MIVQYLAEKYGRYGNVGRAAFGHASQLRVMFGLSLIQVEIDEQDDAMKTSAWVRYVGYLNDLFIPRFPHVDYECLKWFYMQE